MTLTITVGALAGFVFGFVQSFLVGLRAGSWAGGTGLAWGFLIAVPSAVAAIWLGWFSVLAALVLATGVLVISLIQISRDR
jgi:hypothetical protein